MLRILCPTEWGRPVRVAQSEGHPWNGWVAPLEEEHAPESFEAGAYLAALEHIRQCPKCRQANNLSLVEVECLLRTIEKAWREVQ